MLFRSKPQGPALCPLCPPNMFGGFGIGGVPFGKGGNPSIGTNQVPPKKGNEKDAGFPWELFKKLGEELPGKLKGAYDKGKKSLDDFFTKMGNPEKALENGMYDLGKELGKIGKNLDPKVMDQMLKQFNKDFNNTFSNLGIAKFDSKLPTKLNIKPEKSGGLSVQTVYHGTSKSAEAGIKQTG